MFNLKNRKELDEIIKRYVAGTASPEEERFVESYFSFVEDKAAKENQVSEDLEQIRDHILGRIHNGLAEKERTPVVQAILQQKAHPRKIGVPQKIWFRAAAAIFIGLLTLTTYFLLKPKQQTDLAKTQNQKTIDVAPGTNKAILTLGNGSKIILDSAANGLLAKQNNTNIIKTDSGKLVYNLFEKPTNKNNPNPSEIVYNILSTPRGGQYQLILPDGTKVWLNSASSISYPTAFAGNERKVTVTGEVYFEVVHNPTMPFRVKTADLIIEDIGTAFNVNGYSDEPVQKTTLLEGSIKIKDQILKPGQQAQMTGDKIKLVSGVDLGKVVAWKNGKISLANSSVEQIMREISRWYDVDIKYEGKIPDQKFYGIIDRNVPLSTVLLALKNYGVETKMEAKTIIVQ